MKKIVPNISWKLALIAGLAPFSLSVYADGSFPKSSPKDPGVINEERIEYWLKKRGEIKPNATEQEIRAIVDQYKARATLNQPLHKFSQPVKLNNQLQKKTNAPKTVKALGLLIDFPDLPYDDNRLDSGDTGMYYDNYSVDHYRQLMFSTTGYTGPSNQNLMSGYQFYQEVSGGEFFFTGDVFGWVTADSNAATYGGNDPDNDDNDLDAPKLIEEAIAKVVAANTIDLEQYDIEDPYDLNGNGIVNEADGFIDHINVFHSSVGEEAGGGVLGDDAIWSHRFFVNQTGNPTTMGYAIPGTNKRIFGYTIQPIDAATGVVVHEFGHDLGLPDEYDTGSSDDGAPTGNWSVMAGGSWTGSPSGTMPVGFSPYARENLQAMHGTNFLNQVEVHLNDLSGTSESYNLVEAVNHASGVNQIKVNLPEPLVDFGAPYTASYQYYSERGDNLSNEMSFDLDVPAGTSVSLSMKSRWAIEADWDYVQVSVNNQVIAGNHTNATNPLAANYPSYASVVNYISGNSLDIAGAEGALGWVDLTFDLSSYQGQSVSIKFEYITDANTGDYGFVVDDLVTIADGNETFVDGAETAGTATLNGFERITDKSAGKPRNYYIQLRSHNGVDEGLSSRGYDGGVVLWFADSSYSDNKVGDHPGHGFIGVVDADQNLIGTQRSSVQIRDAAFSLYQQSSYSQDNSLNSNSTFDDANDYSSPNKPAAGLVLPNLGFSMNIDAQATNNTTATITLAAGSIALAADFSTSSSERNVTFADTTTGGSFNYTYDWDFGDGVGVSTASSPVYQYATDGTYTVTLTVTDTDQNESVSTKTVTLDTAPLAAFSSAIANEVVTFTNTSTGGVGGLSYAWDFGDGESSTSASPSHTYTEDGTYVVSLVITDAEGRSSTSTGANVVIDTRPVSGFSVSTNNLTATFTDTTTGGRGSLTYAWDFGDGASSTDQSPSHTYAAAAIYVVTLTVTDGNGITSQTTSNVTVQEPPAETESSGGGGALTWLSLSLLALIRRTRQAK